MIVGSLSGCVNLQTQWNSATEEERVRIVLDQTQTGLDALLDMGVAYVAAHPEKKADWPTRVLPLFKAVNGMIGENIRLAKANAGKVTVPGVLAAIQPKITEIETIAIEWGFKK
jgi:hypothetical protein